MPAIAVSNEFIRKLDALPQSERAAAIDKEERRQERAKAKARKQRRLNREVREVARQRGLNLRELVLVSTAQGEPATRFVLDTKGKGCKFKTPPAQRRKPTILSGQHRATLIVSAANPAPLA